MALSREICSPIHITQNTYCHACIRRTGLSGDLSAGNKDALGDGKDDKLLRSTIYYLLYMAAMELYKSTLCVVFVYGTSFIVHIL